MSNSKSTLPNKWHCALCNQNFSRKFFLEKHYASGKHLKKAKESRPLNEVEKLREENERLSLQVQKLLVENDKLRNQVTKRPKTNTYSGNSKHYENCTINNIQFNVNVLPHGDENWEYLKDDVLNIMRGVNTCIPEIVRKLHFDRDHPENHNLKLPNKRFPDMKVFNGSDWITTHKKDVIESMIIQLVDKLEEEYGEDFRNQSTNFIQKLWEAKTEQIVSEQKVDINLRKQVEYSIIDGQREIKNS